MRNQSPPAPARRPTFPHTSEQLLDELERRWPEPRTRPGEDLATVMFNAGARSVVTTMRALFEASKRKAE